MKKIFFIIISALLLLSCSEKTKIEKQIEKLPITVKIERFDRLFYETNPADLAQLKAKYPFFFPKEYTDDLWKQKSTNPLLRELYMEVQKKYPNLDTLEENVETMFKHIKYHFPELQTPTRVISIISEVDYHLKTYYSDSLAFVSLDVYLGENHRFYEFPSYQKQNFIPEQIMPDLAESFGNYLLPPSRNHSFLAEIIQAGKLLYIKDLLLPETNDATKMGYKPEQLAWCQANENEVWTYFIDKKILYETDPKLLLRFVDPAPFSKFYLDIDAESPGKVGAWIGWQIVRSFAQNNKTTPKELLKTDAITIFNNSKYKPKKL